MVKSSGSGKVSAQLITSFSFTTPIGIALGFVLNQSLNGILSSLITEIIKSIASGTFIYVALTEILLQEFSEKISKKEDYELENDQTHSHISSSLRYKKFLFVMMGVSLMTIFSIYSEK